MSATAIAVDDTLELDLGYTDVRQRQGFGISEPGSACGIDPAVAVSPASCSLLSASSGPGLSQLRRRIDLITAIEPADGSAGLGTGIPELDAVLSGRGLPRGRLTEVTGVRGSGKATLLRRMVVETISRGLGVAYVDASRTLAPRDWASVAGVAGDAFWVVRPKQASRGAWCADVLLRSGAFALVVLDGAPPLTRSIAVRLTRLAHDAAAALVVVGGDHAPPSMLSGALRLHVSRARKSRRDITTAGADPPPPLPPGVMTRWMTITVEKGGGRGQRQTVEVEHAVSVAHRLCAHPEVPDRRGAARTGGRGSKQGHEERTGAERQHVEHLIPELASVG
jgi:recombination protein RecA